MQRVGGAAIRHFYLRFMCTARFRCIAGYHAVVLATCNWQQSAPQQGQRVHILARSSQLGANTAGALDLHRDMFYKGSTYIYIFFVVDNRHPAAAVGTPMCGRDPSARSAGDNRHQRAGWRLAAIRCSQLKIYAVFIKIYTQKYTSQGRFWKPRRIIQGVFIWVHYTGCIFLMNSSSVPPPPSSSSFHHFPCAYLYTHSPGCHYVRTHSCACTSGEGAIHQQGLRSASQIWPSSSNTTTIGSSKADAAFPSYINFTLDRLRS
jgi:hypothetical protein